MSLLICPDDAAVGMDVTIARRVRSHTRGAFLNRVPARVVAVDRKPRAPCVLLRVRDERTGRVSPWTNYECGIGKGMRVVDADGNNFYEPPHDGTMRVYLASLRSPFDPSTGWGGFVRLRKYDEVGDYFFSRSWPGWWLQAGWANLDVPRAFNRGEYDPNRVRRVDVRSALDAWEQEWRRAGYPGVDPFHVVLDDGNCSPSFRQNAIRAARAFEEEVQPTGTWLALHRLLTRAVEECSVRQMLLRARGNRVDRG